MDPMDLGIHPAIDVGDAANLQALPPYVRQPHDNAIDEAVANTDSSVMVLVTGDSSTGKTRANY
jgi:hypothetical protein